MLRNDVPNVSHVVCIGGCNAPTAGCAAPMKAVDTPILEAVMPCQMICCSARGWGVLLKIDMPLWEALMPLWEASIALLRVVMPLLKDVEP